MARIIPLDGTMLGSVEIKTRPLRFAFLVDPGSAPQARAAIRLGSTLWGGVFSPIVPMFRRMPAAWRDQRFRASAARAVVSGYLEAFDPDFLVQFADELPAYLATSGRPVIKPTDVWAPLRQGHSRSPGYGIGILEVLEGVFDEHFKYKAKYPVTVKLPVIPKSLGLYWSAFFGELDPDLGPIVEAQYTKPLDIEKVEDIPGDLDGLLSPGVLFPRRLVQHGLRRLRRNFAARGDAIVFFMDASKTDDIIDFWNLRALGRPVIGLPKQLASNESLRGVLVEFLRSHRRHWRDNPTVCDVASFIRSRHTVMDEMQDFAKSLDLNPPDGDSSRDGYYVLQHGFPRVWDSWARDKDGAIPDDFYAGDDGKVELGQIDNRTVRLTAVVPDFAESHGAYSHARCANEVSFSVFGASEHLAQAFPSSYGHSVRRAIGGLVLHDEWRLGRNGLVKMITGVGGVHVRIPAAQDIVFAWLNDQGWKPELSTAGILAKQIFTQCGGHVGFLSNTKVLNLLEHMNGGNVTPDGKPTEKDKLSEERSLSVQHVKSLLQGAADRGDLHGLLLSNTVFRLGVQLQCPSCLRRSWLSLDNVQEEVTCPRCLRNFPAAGTLDRSTWAYKTMGPFSVRNHADGAYAVLLALQCFDRFGTHSLQVSPALSFTATKGQDTLEADFAFLWQESIFGERRDGIVFGESKTYGPFTGRDFNRMRQLARQFPGAVLVFSTLRESLTLAEKRQISRIARAGRRYWKAERPVNPVLVLTAAEILSWHGPPYCWPEPDKSRFQHLHGLLALCDATQQIHLGLPSWQEEWQKAWDRRRARFLRKKRDSGEASTTERDDR